MSRARARTLTIAGAMVLLSAGGAAFALSSTGRPLLLAVTRMAHGGCPFGYDRALTPADRERAREHFATTHRGAEKAEARPALGFTLDETTRSQIVATMARHHVSCSSAKGLSDLTCNDVPSSALGLAPASAPARNLWFTFGLKQQLLSVVAITRAAEPAQISNAFVTTERALELAAGPAVETRGEASPSALSAGILRQASAEFRFRDYYALARATNIGGGYLFTEEYRSLPD